MAKTAATANSAWHPAKTLQWGRDAGAVRISFVWNEQMEFRMICEERAVKTVRMRAGQKPEPVYHWVPYRKPIVVEGLRLGTPSGPVQVLARLTPSRAGRIEWRPSPLTDVRRFAVSMRPETLRYGRAETLARSEEELTTGW